MLLVQQNRRRYEVYTAGGELRIGDIVYINKDKYAVNAVGKSGDAILGILKDEAVRRIKKLIDQHDDKPKKYKSVYNSKHGRIW